MSIKIFILFLTVCYAFVNGFMNTDLVASFFKTKILSHNVILTCYSKNARVQIMKKLIIEKDLVITVKNIENLNILDTLVANYKKLGVVLDGDCAEAKNLLSRCKIYKVFDTKHFWLVLHNSSLYRYLFEYANLNVDCDVKVAYLNNSEYIIDDVYNPSYEKNGKLITKTVGYFNVNEGYQVNEAQNRYVLRKNLTGILFKSLMVLNEPYEKPLEKYLNNDKNIEIDSLGRFHARVMQYCKDYYNYSEEIIGVTNSWGYYKPDGTMDGLVGSLERKQVDFGLSPLVAKTERTKFITFGKGTWHLRMAFLFRNPNSKRSVEIFIKPLSFYVWICIITSLIMGVISQKLSFGMDKLIAERLQKLCNCDNSWGSNVLCILGAFCQQGIISFPNCLSGRISALVLLWLGLIIYQFYSSSLVSFLLNVPVNVITSLQGLLNTDFGLGYENVLYAKSLLQGARDPVAKQIYKIVSAQNQSGFIRRDEGLELVKNGHFAFHVELVTAYKFMDKYFDLPIICELKEIPLFPRMYMYSGYQKWSSYKDVLDMCLYRFEENGVMSRELKFWHPNKPQCLRTPATIKVNTSLEDFYPALAILVLGILLSLEILVVEIIWQYRNKQKHTDKALHPYTE